MKRPAAAFGLLRTSSMTNVRGASLKRQGHAIAEAAAKNKVFVAETLQLKGVSGTVPLEAHRRNIFICSFTVEGCAFKSLST